MRPTFVSCDLQQVLGVLLVLDVHIKVLVVDEAQHWHVTTRARTESNFVLELIGQFFPNAVHETYDVRRVLCQHAGQLHREESAGFKEQIRHVFVH